MILNSKRKTLDVQVGEETLVVTYAPHRMTPRTLRELAQKERQREKDPNSDEVDSLIDLFRVFGIRWDLKAEGEGDSIVEVGVTPEELLDVDVEILGAVIKAVQEDAAPKATKSAS